MQSGRKTQFIIREDGTLVIKGHICVLDVGELRKHIMDEAHNAPYAMHSGSTKMLDLFTGGQL